MGARERVLDSLERLFADRDVEVRGLDDGQSLSEALDWDSMDIVDLGMEFKRRHGLELPEGLESVDSLALLVKLLESRD